MEFGKKKKKGFFNSVEGIVFFLGIIVFISGFLFVYPLDVPDKWKGMGTMILAGVAGGKGVSIPVGLGFLPRWLVVIVAALHDMVAVFLFYPLIVFFKNQVVSGSFMGNIVRTTEDVARKHQRRLKPLGVLGVGFFVWIPLTMTGPLVGSVLGLLLGMKTITIMSAVTVAAILSAWCWTFLFDFMFRWTTRANQWFPAIAVAIILTLILAIRLQKARQERNQQKINRGASPPPRPEGQASATTVEK